jgi:phosphohistidine phosphatase
MKSESLNMQVYLLRHGIAEENRSGKSDADRELTAEGRRKLRETLRVVAEADTHPSLILTSPLLRAVQTAEIAKSVLHSRTNPLETKALLPGTNPEQVWDEIRVHKDEPELMLVGHDPLFTNLAGYLLGFPGLHIDFKKGAILRVDFESFAPKPRGLLRWFLVAKLAGHKSAPPKR